MVAAGHGGVWLVAEIENNWPDRIDMGAQLTGDIANFFRCCPGTRVADTLYPLAKGGEGETRGFAAIKDSLHLYLGKFCIDLGQNFVKPMSPQAGGGYRGTVEFNRHIEFAGDMTCHARVLQAMNHNCARSMVFRVTAFCHLGTLCHARTGKNTGTGLLSPYR